MTAPDRKTSPSAYDAAMSRSDEPTTGATISKRLSLSPTSIAAFARLAGDDNPLHHDRDAAERSRYGAIIASGPQTTSLLMGLVASHFSRTAAMVGLEFRFRFRGPVFADQEHDYRWQVVATRPNARLGGSIALLAGGVRTADGREAVRAVGKVLVTPKP